MSHPGFAVVDLETTGLFTGRGDRVLEIAVVHVSGDGEITGEWQTLLNSSRDLMPQRSHRIAAADILGAPSFADIALALAHLLAASGGLRRVPRPARWPAGSHDRQFCRKAARCPKPSSRTQLANSSTMRDQKSERSE